jgi:hypothetical protein
LLIEDHISWAGWSPLQGPNDDEWGPRFEAMTDAYDPKLRAVLKAQAAKLGIALPEGIYAWYLGPNFETPAEIRALRGLGADIVGMSTVPEVIVARHCGLRVATISAVTNLAAGMRENQHLSHDHTQRIAKLCAEKLDRFGIPILGTSYRALDLADPHEFADPKHPRVHQAHARHRLADDPGRAERQHQACQHRHALEGVAVGAGQVRIGHRQREQPDHDVAQAARRDGGVGVQPADVQLAVFHALPPASTRSLLHLASAVVPSDQPPVPPGYLTN